MCMYTCILVYQPLLLNVFTLDHSDQNFARTTMTNIKPEYDICILLCADVHTYSMNKCT